MTDRADEIADLGRDWRLAKMAYVIRAYGDERVREWVMLYHDIKEADVEEYIHSVCGWTCQRCGRTSHESHCPCALEEKP